MDFHNRAYDPQFNYGIPSASVANIEGQTVMLGGGVYRNFESDYNDYKSLMEVLRKEQTDREIAEVELLGVPSAYFEYISSVEFSGYGENPDQQGNGGNDQTQDNVKSNKQSKGDKALTIAGSFVTTDPDKTVMGKVLQVASRFTWELPQQLLGFLTAQVTNLFGGIDEAYHKNGALVLSSKWMQAGAGFTLGNVITVGYGSPDWLVAHEFGHYIQSRRFGIGYLPGFALPSVIRAGLWGAGIIGGDYDNFYTESNATRLGNKYWKP